ncbi:MAG: hypothetical protein M3N08_09430 [Pseudomonadota bacterium]|nr:hypothetical protein [Pseudomonadota bacterium]
MHQDLRPVQAHRLRSLVKETWARMTDEEIELYPHQEDQFYDKLHAHYGLPRENAEEQMKWLAQECELPHKAA